jgi:hypothetical protein
MRAVVSMNSKAVTESAQPFSERTTLPLERLHYSTNGHCSPAATSGHDESDYALCIDSGTRGDRRARLSGRWSAMKRHSPPQPHGRVDVRSALANGHLEATRSSQLLGVFR